MNSVNECYKIMSSVYITPTSGIIMSMYHWMLSCFQSRKVAFLKEENFELNEIKCLPGYVVRTYHNNFLINLLATKLKSKVIILIIKS